MPEARKEITGEIAEEFHVSITRACNLMGIHKSYFYYDSVKDDSEIEAAIRQKADGRLRWFLENLSQAP